MSKKNVEILLGKCMLDEDFGVQLEQDFEGTIERTGLEITEEEKCNLLKTAKRMPFSKIHPVKLHQAVKTKEGCWTIDEGCGTLDWDECDDCYHFDCPPCPEGVGDDGDGLIA